MALAGLHFRMSQEQPGTTGTLVLNNARSAADDDNDDDTWIYRLTPEAVFRLSRMGRAGYVAATRRDADLWFPLCVMYGVPRGRYHRSWLDAFSACVRQAAIGMPMEPRTPKITQ